jgi:hypothetical protein
MKIENYKIIKETSIYSLEMEVLRYVKMGWFPIGGVSEITDYGAITYVQAMVKEQYDYTGM